MFEINYVFQDGGPEYRCNYPGKSIKDNNIFLIRAENDQGKSTSMEMIALGLWGLESTDIKKTLKDQMRSLISDDIDKCDFKFTIESPDKKTIIESELKNKKITTKINGRKQGKDYFEKNFKIIFDTPEDPLDKLKKALESVKSKLRDYKSYLELYQMGIREYQNQISDYEHRESQIKRLKKQIKENEKAHKELKKNLELCKKRYEEIEKAYHCIQYKKHDDECIRLDNEIRELNNEIIKLRKAGAQGGTSKYKQLKIKFQEELKDLKHIVNSLSSLPSILNDNEKKNLKRVKKQINDIMTPRDVKTINLKDLRRKFKKFNYNLEIRELTTKKFENEDKLNLILQLLDILINSVSVSGEIPGTEGKTVSQFIEHLEITRDEIVEEHSAIINHKDALQECRDMIVHMENVIEIQIKIPERDHSKEEDIDLYKDKVDQFKKELDDNFKECAKLEDKWDSIESEERLNLMRIYWKTIDTDHNQIKKKLESYLNADTKFEKDIESSKIRLKSFERLGKPPKKESAEFQKEARITRNILAKLETWDKNIDLINVDDMKADKSVDNELMSVLALYFARLLEVVYYENKSWKLKKVDIIKQRYIVEDRNPIKFVRIGTGHTSLNSLMIRLKQDYGGRKKIVLFDEIGIMDKNNINRLLDEIKKQTKSGDVIFSILAKAEDDVTKVIYEPIKIK